VFFRTTLPPSASFWIPHGMGRLSKRANTNERIDAQLNLEFDQMWATFGIVRYGTSCLDRLNASNLSTVRAKFWRKKKSLTIQFTQMLSLMADARANQDPAMSCS
jgi:hypothetical protein